MTDEELSKFEQEIRSEVRNGVYSGDIWLNDRNLTKLPNLSDIIVTGDFYCHNNELTSLEGAPKEVRGEFYCSDNKLTSLEGSPQKVRSHFNCSTNKLTTLKGVPTEIRGVFYFMSNPIQSYDHFPEIVRGNIYPDKGPVSSLARNKFKMLTTMRVKDIKMIIEQLKVLFMKQ